MKFFNRSTVIILTLCEDGGIPDVPADVEYRVRSLGRGLWSVEDEDAAVSVLRTAELQRFFRPHTYERRYWGSGEPVRVYEEVYITRA